MLNVERRDDQGRVVHFHAFRKTFQTFGARAGIGQRSAQAILGHSDPSLTANVYTDEQALALGAEVAKLPWIDAQLHSQTLTKTHSIRPVGEILRELVQAAKSLGDGELIGVGAESRWLPVNLRSKNFRNANPLFRAATGGRTFSTEETILECAPNQSRGTPFLRSNRSTR